MEKLKINKLSEISNDFLLSKWSFVLFLGGTISFSLINYVMFSIGEGFSINTIWFGDITSESSNAWIGWTELTIASIGSFLAILGVIFTLRFNKKFIIPLIIGETLVIIDALILGAIFTALSYFLMIISAIYNFSNWKKNDSNNSNQMNLFNWITVGAFIILYISIGIGATIGTGFYPSEFSSYNDIISSGIVVASWFIILNKSKWGFVGFLLTDITYMFYFFSSGVWATGSSYIIYLFIDSISFIGWWNTN